MCRTTIKLLATALLLSLSAGAATTQPTEAISPSDLTRGWVLEKYTYEIQHPYDLAQGARYQFDPVTNTHDFWVFYTDKPHMPPPNQTEPRTEFRTLELFTTPHMFEADAYIKPGTFACIMQDFLLRGPMMLLVVSRDGTVRDLHSNTVIMRHAYGRWFNLKVIDDPTAGKGLVKVFIDNSLVATFREGGGKQHYFKCGVYSREGSQRNETLYRDIRYWQPAPTTPPLAGDGKG
jgi:hypothetical protein